MSSKANPSAASPEAPVDTGDYAQRLDALLLEADAAGQVAILVDALTWTLARIAGHYGKAWIAGDIVRRFGSGLCQIEERKAAEAEAEAAKKAGRPVH